MCLRTGVVGRVSGLYRVTHRIGRGRSVRVVFVSCMRLLGTESKCSSGHCLSLGCVAHHLGRLTGRLRIPMIVLSRLGHREVSNRKLRRGHPHLTSLESDKAITSSDSVIVLLRHPRCCRVCSSRQKGSLRNLVRVDIPGGQLKPLKHYCTGFGASANLVDSTSSLISGVNFRISSPLGGGNDVPPPPPLSSSLNPLPF